MPDLLDTPQTDASELSGVLRNTVDDTGRWRFATLAEDLGVQDWMRWFALRLTNRDPFFGYDREEREHGQVNLFSNLFRRLHRSTEVEGDLVRALEADAAAGLHFLMRELDGNLDEVSSNFLHDVFDLIGRIRVRRTPAAENVRAIVREWIESEALLDEREGRISPELLHRSALFALSDLQEQGDERYRDVWERWFEEGPFKLAAFSGMARCAEPHPPEGWVRDLLDYADQARENGTPVMEGLALESLYMGDLDPETVMWYLWDEAQDADEPRDTWNRLQDLLADTDAELLAYDHMDVLPPTQSSAPDPVPAGPRDDDTSGWSKFL
jgi:hypothetical protein